MNFPLSKPTVSSTNADLRFGGNSVVSAHCFEL